MVTGTAAEGSSRHSVPAEKGSPGGGAEGTGRAAATGLFKKPAVRYGFLAAFATAFLLMFAVFRNGEGPGPAPGVPTSGTSAPPAPSPESRGEEKAEIPSREEPSQAESPAEDAPLQRGLQALEERRFEDAAEIFEEILARDPELRDEVAVPYAEALSGQALPLMEKDFEKSEALLQKATEMAAHRPDLHFHLGRLYMNAEDYERAAEAYHEVIRRDPRHSEALFNLGFIYARHKEFEKAEEMYTRVVDLEPPYLDEALVNLAVLQGRKGDTERSRENLERALELNPDNQLAVKYLQKLHTASGERP